MERGARESRAVVPAIAFYVIKHIVVFIPL